MNSIFALATQNTVVALVLAAIVYGLTRVWRNPPLAHVLWLLVLLKLVAPPIVPFDRSALCPAEATPPRELNIDDVSQSPGHQPESQSPFVDQPTATATAEGPATGGGGHDFAAGLGLLWKRGEPILLGLWLGGAVACALVAVTRIVRFERLLRGTLPASGRLERLASEVAGKLGVGWVPDVRYAECVEVPLLWCAGRRPTIVLPMRLLRQLDDEQARLILAHELAHLRRRDHWVRGVELIVSAVCWWNPLVWVIRRQIHQAEELCCDAWVRWALPDCTRRYAEVLLRAAESLGESAVGARLLPASPLLHSLSLKARIQMILEGRFAPQISTRSMVAVALLALLVWPSLVETTKAQATAGAKDEAVLTAARLRGALEQTVRKLEHCHIVAVNEGSQNWMLDDGYKPRPADLLDIWLSGNHVQLRVTPGTAVKDDWWIDSSFLPLDAPLTVEDADFVPGLKECLRPEGDFVWMDSRPLRNPRVSTSLYSRSATPQRIWVFYLPLVQLNRPWVAPSLPVDQLLDVPVESWRVIGPADLNGAKTVLVEVPKQPPRRHKLPGRDDELEIAKFWKVWFSASAAEGYFPLRIELAVRYGIGGMQGYAELPPASPSPSTEVFEAREITELAPGVYYPRFGKVETFMTRPEQKAQGVDITKMIDQIASQGKFSCGGDWVLATRYQWRVLKLETIPPTKDLWIDPPKNTQVYDVNTEARFIEGVSEEESRRRLGVRDGG